MVFCTCYTCISITMLYLLIVVQLICSLEYFINCVIFYYRSGHPWPCVLKRIRTMRRARHSSTNSTDSKHNRCFISSTITRRHRNWAGQNTAVNTTPSYQDQRRCVVMLHIPLKSCICCNTIWLFIFIV